MMAPKHWRDVLPVHPAVDLFPMMSEADLRELGEDIKKNGLRSPIVLWSPGDQLDKSAKVYLLDGRNRLDAMERVGMETVDKDGKLSEFLGGSNYLRGIHGIPVAHLHEISVSHAAGDLEMKEPIRKEDTDPYVFVLSANIHRRHLTSEQKRELIAKLIKQTPNKSNRQIAEQVKVDHKTVGAIRAEGEARGEIPHAERRIDAKGRKQPSAKPKRTGVASKDTALFDFDARVLDLRRRIANHCPDRFAKTAVAADDLAKVGKFLVALAKLVETSHREA
jgi:hypothetical protein